MLVAVAIMALMHLGTLTLTGVAATGFGLGLATGLFWANRVVLALATTEDGNRNYYYGVELFAAMVASVAMPAAIGWFLAGTAEGGWLGGVVNRGYHAVALVSLLLTVLAAGLLERGRFRRIEAPRFLYLRFHRLWKGMLGLAALKGMAQGYILAAPALLVMLFLGAEGTLGTLQAAGGVLSAVLLYTLGRAAGVRARQAIFAAGLTLFLAGSLANAMLFSAAGVYLFLACLLPAKPRPDGRVLRFHAGTNPFPRGLA